MSGTLLEINRFISHHLTQELYDKAPKSYYLSIKIYTFHIAVRSRSE